ncbi:hypothetical protein YC2023_036532 [Brassica napus]
MMMKVAEEESLRGGRPLRMEKGEKIDSDGVHETATECGGGGRRSPGGLVGGGVARLSPETRMGGLSPEEWCGAVVVRWC